MVKEKKNKNDRHVPQYIGGDSDTANILNPLASQIV